MFFLCTTGLLQAGTLVVNPGPVNIYIGKYLDVYEEKVPGKSFQQVHEQRGLLFTPSAGEMLNFGFTRSVIWLKFSIDDRRSVKSSLMLDTGIPFLDDLRVFVPAPDGTYSEISAGDLRPFHDRPFEHRNFIIPLPDPVHETLPVYIRVQSGDSMMLPIRLVSPDVVHRDDRNEGLFYGFYYGIFFIMILYNLFLYLSLRDRNYLFYILYLAAYSLFQLSYNGVSFQYLWPGSPWFHHKGLIFFTSTGLAAGMVFANTFLRLKIYAPVMRRIFRVVIPLALLYGFLAFFIDNHYGLIFANIIALICSFLTLTAAIFSYRGGYKAARFFLAGWIIFLSGVCIVSLTNQGFMEFSFFTNNAAMLGSIAEVSLLSLALADRVSFIRKEREEARQKIKDMEARQLISLEKLVAERTVELENERNVIRNRNDVIEKELNLAMQIQMQMLPSRAPADTIASVYIPMAKLGGDFYDYIRFRDDEKTGIFISDVSGHGVPAAFITSMIKSVILEAGSRKESPAGLMNFINSIVYSHTGGNFITAFYGVFDSTDKTFTYCNAGHFPPYLISGGSLTELEQTGCPALAIADNEFLDKMGILYKEKKIQLKYKDKLVLYTDGLIEANSLKTDEMFQHSGMEDVLKAYSYMKGGDYLTAVMDELIIFRGESSFDDDICIVTLDVP